MKHMKIRKILGITAIIITYPFLMLYYFVLGGITGAYEFIFDTHELLKAVTKK